MGILIDQLTGDKLRLMPAPKRPPGFRFSRVASDVLLESSKELRFKPFQALDLLYRGANPNVHDKLTWTTPLHFCARRGNLQVMKLLVNAGANCNALDNRFQNPLLLACDTKLASRVKMVRYLLKQKGVRNKLELHDAGGSSALKSAIFKENFLIVRELLLAGASATAPGPDNSTAYDVALFVYCASLMMDIDQLPLAIKEPRTCWWKYFSLKGHYYYYPLMQLQSVSHHNTELIFRMLQRKKKEEEQYGIQLPRAPPSVSKSGKKAVTEQEIMKKNNKLRKAVLHKHAKQEKDNLTRWNSIRKEFAKRIDREFSKNLRGVDGEEPHEWVKQEKEKGMEYKVLGKDQWVKQPAQNKSIYPKPPKMKNIHESHKEISYDEYAISKHNAINPNNKIELNPEINSPEYKYAKKIGLERDEKDPKAKWKVASRTDIGFVDVESRWAKIREASILIAPEDSDEDEERDLDAKAKIMKRLDAAEYNDDDLLKKRREELLALEELAYRQKTDEKDDGDDDDR